MRRNTHSNRMMKWIVMIGDFVLMNAIILLFYHFHWRMAQWSQNSLNIFILVSNIALILSQARFPVIIHLRLVNTAEFSRRLVGLTAMQVIVTYLLLKVFSFHLPVERLLLELGTVYVVLLFFKRLAERWIVKLYRLAGRNFRSVTLVGNDPNLEYVYQKLKNDLTLGYRIVGYYGDAEIEGESRLGTMNDFINSLDEPDKLQWGDELYICTLRKNSDLIRRVSNLCDHHLTRFYYVPVSVESIGLNLKSTMIEELEIYTTYENPLQNSLNRIIKRLFDIVFALIFLIPVALLFPFIFVITKWQSPGPIFFKQLRTGLDGKSFFCYKFRSMHVNKEADTMQATKDDPRKFPFGNFMRRTNIDELPQFWNVLIGEMSVVGPRPHMLTHTEMYAKLIDKYMVRHFVKPGVTGWAQVTGFRGETKELWQMEERIRRDIWYMEHWSFWLDIRIAWMTLKTIFIHDENAY